MFLEPIHPTEKHPISTVQDSLLIWQPKRTGDSRGATWVSIHNGGGVGWGEVINGGFGMVLDGTKEASKRLESPLFWDVNNGISRKKL
jgi:urocanate hydratase